MAAIAVEAWRRTATGCFGVKVLVFGKTGQVARELARLCPSDIMATFLGRGQVNLANPRLCGDVIGRLQPDAVINAAAWTKVDLAERHEPDALVINGDAPGAMAAVCARHSIPFLHLSTDYVFDGAGNKPFRPDDGTAPLNAYGRTKLAGETAVLAAGGRHLILRTSWIVSSHGTNFVKTMLRLGHERPSLNVVADQVGAPTPAASLAAALWHAALCMAKGAPGGIHHFAGRPNISWADFARTIFSTAGVACEVCDIATSDYPTLAQRPLNSRLDCSSFCSAFGLPRPDWREGLTTILKDLGAIA